MSRNRYRIVLGLAAIVAVTVVVWLVREPQGTRREHAPATAHDAAQRATEPDAALHKSGGSTTARVSASQPPGDVDEQHQASAITIAIVRADTLAPIPDARVLWWPARVFDRANEEFESWLRRSAVEEHVSESLESRSDEHGLARLFDALQGGTVVATSEGLWGRATIGGGRQDRISVELAPDVGLRVRIVDTHGTPVAGAMVALRQLGHLMHTDHLTARADSSGNAVLRHVGLWWSAASTMATGYVVAVPGLLDPPCMRVLDRETLASEPIELVLEASGSCAVEVVDGLGRVLSEPFHVRLCFADGRPSNAVETVCETSAARAPDGVVFEQVELGRELSVEVTRDGVSGSLSARGLGPRQAGERVSFRLQLDARALNVAGRAVDHSGAPLGGLTLSAELETDDGRTHGEEAWTTRTNSDGRFVLEIRASAASSNEVLLVLCAQNATDSGRTFARRALPRDLSSGLHDLGDITLEESPLVVAGQVVDTEGHSVAEAIITAVVPLSAAEPGASGRAVNAVPLSARSDPDGRFTLRGVAVSDDVVVRAHKTGYADRALRARRGAASLRLVLGPAGTITGKVLLDPSLRSTAVLVEATPDQGAIADDRGPSVETKLLANDGGFTVSELCAGAYSVRVLYAATGCELGRVDRVIVESGRANRDDRLDPLDLRATHRLIQLELVDESGAVVPGGSCGSRVSDDPRAPTIVTRASSGRLPLLYAGRPLDVSVSATGFLDTELERVSESRRVMLSPPAKLRLEIVRGLPALAADLRLGARLTPVDARRLQNLQVAGSGTFDSHGVLVCETPFAGEVSIDLVLTATDAKNPHVEYLKSCAPRTIRLESHRMEQAFQIGFDSGELARAIEAIRSDR